MIAFTKKKKKDQEGTQDQDKWNRVKITKIQIGKFSRKKAFHPDGTAQKIFQWTKENIFCSQDTYMYL